MNTKYLSVYQIDGKKIFVFMPVIDQFISLCNFIISNILQSYFNGIGFISLFNKKQTNKHYVKYTWSSSLVQNIFSSWYKYTKNIISNSTFNFDASQMNNILKFQISRFFPWKLINIKYQMLNINISRPERC